jgi:quercetin dioxygenase-like cupin family protein
MLKSPTLYARPPETARIKPVRRVITGHDSQGRSIVLEDRHAPFVTTVGHEEFGITDVWHSSSLPADNEDDREPCSPRIELEPRAAGNLIRIVQFPPDRDYVGKVDAKDVFGDVGASGLSAMSTDSEKPHDLMHKTNTVDYIVVISGEIYAVLDTGETLLRAGDVLIQRGTNHAWSNRSDSPCFVAAILNGAKPIAR